MQRLFVISLIASSCLFAAYVGNHDDNILRRIIAEQSLNDQGTVPEFDSIKVELGRLLFFDKLLSGNKDISCATCHHPDFASADGLALSIGVGGTGLGTERVMGSNRERIPRNAPELFNRGSSKWHTMFWDSRLSGTVEEGFTNPADGELPDGLENIVAAQAMFPVTSRDEMRGDIGDLDVNGEVNELALISNASESTIWHRIMMRILDIDEYRHMFSVVYPEIAPEDLGFQHAANAIAAYEIQEFTFNDSPWDRYIAGDNHAISDIAKRGAIVFYDEANCASCHSGSLMTDQEHHNLGLPQIGPGKVLNQDIDAGRFLESGDPKDRYAFRTPPLKNVAITGPWMHNGAYNDLAEVIRHHLDPMDYLERYDPEFVEPELRPFVQTEPQLTARIAATLDPLVLEPGSISASDMTALIAFMEALTDESALDLSSHVPASVPSGLPVPD